MFLKCLSHHGYSHVVLFPSTVDLLLGLPAKPKGCSTGKRAQTQGFIWCWSIVDGFAALCQILVYREGIPLYIYPIYIYILIYIFYLYTYSILYIIYILFHIHFHYGHSSMREGEEICFGMYFPQGPLQLMSGSRGSRGRWKSHSLHIPVKREATLHLVPALPKPGSSQS